MVSLAGCGCSNQPNSRGAGARKLLLNTQDHRIQQHPAHLADAGGRTGADQQRLFAFNSRQHCRGTGNRGFADAPIEAPSD